MKSIVGTFNSDKMPKFIFEGCRIVDLKYVQEQMTGACSVRQKTLKLDNIINETRQRLASLSCIQANVKRQTKFLLASITF